MNIADVLRADINNCDWTCAPHLALLYSLATVQAPLGLVVDLGTGPGRSTRALLAGARNVFTIDNADKSFPLDSGVSCKFIVDDTAGAAARFRDRSVSLLFIDANHERTAVLRDLGAWEQKMMGCGIIVGHDWDLAAPGQDGVKAAVLEYLALQDPDGKRWALQIFRADVSSFILWPQVIK